MNEAKLIRAELKALGFTAKHVSVRTSRGSAVNVNIKSPLLSMEVAEKIGKKYESVTRCEHSGEILSGGNTFIFVSYDWDYKRETEQSYSELKELMENTGEGVVIVYDGQKVYWLSSSYGKRFYIDSGDDFTCDNGFMFENIAIKLNELKAA